MSIRQIIELETRLDRAEIAALRRQEIDPIDYLNQKVVESGGQLPLLLARWSIGLTFKAFFFTPAP